MIDSKPSESAFRFLLFGATTLALSVVGLGGYVRLKGAGLGCPDWPGCYGHILVPEFAADTGRAWIEMGHRYAAGCLGVSIFLLAALAWRRRPTGSARRGVLTWLSGFVAFQALLGMWTVTQLLEPLIVTAHLLGGMLIWALLIALCHRECGTVTVGPLGWPGGVALAALLVQIALGGGVSSHYAGLACPDFPACSSSGLPETAAQAIHFAHRLWALIALVAVGGHALRCIRQPGQRPFGFAIAILLTAQLASGIASVLLTIPLPLALAHNVGAALLLAAVTASVAGLRE
jgi:heme a synthase